MSIRFLESSKDNLLHIAIVANSIVSTSISLPSAMQVDPELGLEYFENVLAGLSVEHDSNKRLNTIVLQ